MNEFYPITLRLSGRNVVVVGGGKVAERKVMGLLDTGATITVVSPQVTEKIRQFANDGKIRWLDKAVAAEDLKTALLIFAATDDSELNQKVKQAAKAHQLVTIADDREKSDFHVPAQMKRGKLNIAVSTGGASPILARKICQQLEEKFDEGYVSYLEFLFQARRKIIKEVKDPEMKARLLAAIVRSEYLKNEDRQADFLRLYKKLVSIENH